MAKTLGYRFLYDPDYTPNKNGRYYDDTPPCSHGHKHHVHDASCEQHHGDKIPTCAHEHHVHDPHCSHNKSDKHHPKDNDIFSVFAQNPEYEDFSSASILDYSKKDQESDDDDGPPPLIDLPQHLKTYETLEYIPGENSPEFPDYPEFDPLNCELIENIEDKKSLFRKKLETIWDYCWGNICAFILYCKPLAAPLIKFYHKVYIPYVLVNLLNLCGGPKHAGRIGRYARISQFFGASLTWGSLIALIVIVGFTSVWTLGLAAPLWALILGFGGVGINMAGSMVAAAANHGKIDPFYREEIKLHDENNTLRRQLRIPEMGLEHGFLHSSEERQNVHMHRYEHDAQTWVVGSGSSIAASVLEFASIAVGLGGIFLMISRFSSAVSLFGASYVNQDRLFLFKKVISKKINSYYELKHRINHAKHKSIYQILSKTFNDLKINKNHYYSRWVKFYCYRAIDAAYLTDTNILEHAEDIKKILGEKLKDFTEEDSSFWSKHIFNPKTKPPYNMRFSRNKLRGFHAEELSRRPGFSDFDAELSVLDTLPVLEGFMRNALENTQANYFVIDNIVNTFQEKNMYAKDETSTLFTLHLKSALFKASQNKDSLINISAITSQDIEKSITANGDFFCAAPDSGKKIINKITIAQAYPIRGPHGAQIMPDYHTKILVDNIIIPTLKNITHVENIPQLIDDFYHSNMNKLDASSSLFILHLKCALIEHSIKAVTKEAIHEAVESGGDLFYNNNKHYSLNKEKIAQVFKIDDKHGGLTEPDDPARELVRRMIIPHLKQKYASKDILAPCGSGLSKDPSLVLK